MLLFLCLIQVHCSLTHGYGTEGAANENGGRGIINNFCHCSSFIKIFPALVSLNIKPCYCMTIKCFHVKLPGLKQIKLFLLTHVMLQILSCELPWEPVWLPCLTYCAIPSYLFKFSLTNFIFGVGQQIFKLLLRLRI